MALEGVLILLGIIAFRFVMCGVVPFWLMPKLGVAVALPVIMCRARWCGKTSSLSAV